MPEERFGRQRARDLMLAMVDSVDEIARVCQYEGIDAQFHQGGILTLSRGDHHLASLRSAFEAYGRLGLESQYQLLSADQVRERVRVTNVCAGLFAAENASVHPGRLVRGIARAVEKRCGTIYEKTEVVGFEGGSNPRLITPAGDIRVRQALVLAGESYLTRLPLLHRVVLPVYSLIVLTEPLTDQQWSEIGWQNRESLASCNYTVDYLTRTADGRILFGSRGAPYRFRSKISDEQDRHGETHARIEELVVEWFPVLKGIRFMHEWGGSVGMPRDWMPMTEFDPALKIATARGCTDRVFRLRI
jgi:glycine/D-amino acid oxidase-like deaminating enzyme